MSPPGADGAQHRYARGDLLADQETGNAAGDRPPRPTFHRRQPPDVARRLDQSFCDIGHRLLDGVSGGIAAMARLQRRDLVRRRAAGNQHRTAPSRSTAQATARRASSVPGYHAVGIEMQHRHRLLRIRNLLQRRLRTTARKARRRAADRRAGSRTRPESADLAGRHQRPRQSKPDSGSTDRKTMIQRDRADGLQIEVEHGIDDGGANALSGEIRKARPDRLGAPHQESPDRRDRFWSCSAAPAPAPDWNRASG